MSSFNLISNPFLIAGQYVLHHGGNFPKGLNIHIVDQELCIVVSHFLEGRGAAGLDFGDYLADCLWGQVLEFFVELHFLVVGYGLVLVLLEYYTMGGLFVLSDPTHIAS